MIVYRYNSMRSQSRSRSRSSSGTTDRNRGNFAEPNKRLFISGLNAEMEDEDVRPVFEKQGAVNDFFLKRQDNGGAYAFIEFDRQDQADRAMEKLNGSKIAGRMIWVKYANPKPKREGGGRDGGGDRQFGGGSRGGGFRGDRDDGGRRFGGRGDDRGDRGGRGGDRGRGRGRGGGRFEGGRDSSDRYEDSRERGGFERGGNRGDNRGENRNDRNGFSSGEKPERFGAKKPEVEEEVDY